MAVRELGARWRGSRSSEGAEAVVSMQETAWGVVYKVVDEDGAERKERKGHWKLR